MKKIAILTNYKEKPFYEKDIYKDASKKMKKVFLKNNIKLVKVSLYRFDKNKKCFKEHIDINKDGEMIIIKGDYKPDIIFNRIKSGNLFNNITLSDKIIIPSFKTIEIAKDKYEMSLFLKEMQPKTFLLSTFYKESNELSKQIGEKLVLKPINGNSGDGIKFLTKKQLIEKKDYYQEISKMFIIQEYKDFSKGYNKIISGIHDVRLVYIGGKFSFCIVRKPAKGNLKSNIGAGGKQFSLKKSQIPNELFELSNEAMKRLGSGKLDIFSIDYAFCKDENKWYIIEINCSPGIWFPEKDEKYQIKYFNDLCNLFNSIG